MSTRFGASVRLRTRAEFDLVQRQGRRVATRYLILLGHPNPLDRDRLGIIASRRFGHAVSRVRAKRRIRELFRSQEPDIAKASGRQPLDVVVIPRREILSAPLADVEAAFTSALSRLRGMKEVKP
jgi:ribonuclease P protein component